MGNIICFLVVFFAINLANGQSILRSDVLPFDENFYQELSTQKNDILQRNLEKIVASNKTYSKLAAQKRLAIGLVDLRQVERIGYASINGKHMMYAASLPKIAVLLTAMESISEGCLTYDEDLKRDLRLMIAKSNNAATTRVIEKVGFEKIASVMRDDKYDLYDKNKGGGLWVGKKYAKSGKKKPDPLKGLSHAATVEQVCRFYTMLAYGKLVSPEYNAEMMTYMIDPEINHKFVKSFNKIAPDADVYRKSGSWRTYHADSALIFGDNGRRYILVALIDSPLGSGICTNLVKDAERALGIRKSLGKENLEPIAVGPVISPGE